MKTQNYDVVIVGGGPVGLAFAASLGGSNINILLVEKAPLESLKNPKDDGREVALTHASVQILTELGVWGVIDKTLISPIKRAQVFDGLDKMPLDFNADKSKLEALGYLVANYLIRKALFSVVIGFDNITLLNNTSFVSSAIVEQDNIIALSQLDNAQNLIIKTKLLVAADSRMSSIRSHLGIATQMRDFAKTMIVCRMEHNNPHQDIAYEYFYYGKTLALLPLSKKTCSVVITLTHKQAKEALAMDELDFNNFVSQDFAHELGQMNLIGKRHSYPLLGVLADTFITQRCALIGDAAVGMHPVTAHGFNLGLRGQKILTQEIQSAKAVNMDIGSSFVLKAYHTKQNPISKLMYYGTNGVVSLFAGDNKRLQPLRKFALKFAGKFPPVHYLITKHLTQTNSNEFIKF